MRLSTTRTRRRLVAALAAGTLVVAGCGGGGGSNDADRSDDTEQSDTDTDESDSDTDTDTDETETDTDTDTEESDSDTDTFESDSDTDLTVPPVEVPALTGELEDIIIRDTITDLNAWWAQVFGEFYPGQSYFPPTAGAWTMRPGQEVQCGSILIRWEDVADNAFYVPCDETSDVVMLDIENFIPGVVRDSGQFAAALIAAHEWGHLIQSRGGEGVQTGGTVTVFKELQADCFAGAWTAHVINDGTPFEMTGTDADHALAALISIADPVGIDASVEGAHGTAFDRVSAFTAGLKDPVSCASFQTSPPPVFEFPFSTPEEEANGGNLDVLTLIDLVTKDLTTFFLSEVDANYPLPPVRLEESDCDGVEVALAWCPSLRSIVFNADRLGIVHGVFGDWATATLLARAYAEAGGLERDVTDCVSGAFANTLFLSAGEPNSQYNLQLSPGDLDEAVRVYLVESEDGSGILAVDNLRTGLLGGVQACVALAGN